MAELNQIVEQLSTLSVLEAAELVKKLEEKWGVSAAAPVAVAAAGGGAAAAAGPGIAFSERVRERLQPQAQQRPQAADDPDGDRGHRGECENAGVDLDGGGARQVVGREHDGLALDRPPFELRPAASRPEVVGAPRIGISVATDLPWRSCAAGSAYLSRPLRRSRRP